MLKDAPAALVPTAPLLDGERGQAAPAGEANAKHRAALTDTALPLGKGEIPAKESGTEPPKCIASGTHTKTHARYIALWTKEILVETDRNIPVLLRTAVQYMISSPVCYLCGVISPLNAKQISIKLSGIDCIIRSLNYVTGNCTKKTTDYSTLVYIYFKKEGATYIVKGSVCTNSTTYWLRLAMGGKNQS